MLNWRAKIGLICPGVGVTPENVFNKYAPVGVGITSMHIPWGVPGGGPTPENLKMMASGLEQGCRQYYDPRIKQDVVIFGCTSGSLIGGPTFDKECIKIIEDITGSIGTTTTTAVMVALERLGAGKVALMAPYPDSTNEMEREFLIKNGIEVTELMNLNPEQTYIAALDPTFVYQQAKKINKQGAEALFISCTGLDCMDVIQVIEEDFGLPVITSNQASLWQCLRLARVGTKRPDLGKLFTL